MLSRKRYQDASENLGLYWTRRRETCIELLNKFTSFQLVVCFFFFFFCFFRFCCYTYQKFAPLLYSLRHTAIRHHFARLSAFYVNLLFHIVFKIYLPRFFLLYAVSFVFGTICEFVHEMKLHLGNTSSDSRRFRRYSVHFHFWHNEQNENNSSKIAFIAS